MVVNTQAPSSTISKNGRALDASTSLAGPVRPDTPPRACADAASGRTSLADPYNSAAEQALTSAASANTDRHDQPCWTSSWPATGAAPMPSALNPARTRKQLLACRAPAIEETAIGAEVKNSAQPAPSSRPAA